MPRLSTLVAPGSPYRVFRLQPHSARVSLASQSLHYHACPRPTCFSRRNSHRESLQISTRSHSQSHNQFYGLLAAHGHLTTTGTFASDGEQPNDLVESKIYTTSEHYLKRSDQEQESCDRRDARRPGPTTMVVYSIQNESRQLYYASTPPHDLSYLLETAPLSLQSILAHYIHAVTSNSPNEAEKPLRPDEIKFLKSQGIKPQQVAKWAKSVLDGRSVKASFVFKGWVVPPLFLVSLFLRRKRMRVTAFENILRHLQFKVRSEDICWSSLQILLVRLLRHARALRPEAIPWIASLYCTQATRIYREREIKDVDMAYFSNTVLQQISLPTTENPLRNSKHQEKAQFEVLRFMASCEPALVLSRRGFRALVRTQLARPKTAQEREWASLKGTSWPPWKEERNAMDEDKGYEFGASRASRIMHKMFEAGYEPGAWEQIAEIYAGWDTDRSPTIQWRTSFPHVSTAISPNKANSLIWAARVRATRTRREAWACFLACEASADGASAEVYFAMFEKLHSRLAEEQDQSHVGTESGRTHQSLSLPGDTSEVMPEARSPLHHVYLDEPVPSFEQLYHRLITRKIHLNGRLVAFLIGTLPNFSTTVQLLEATQHWFSGGLKYLLEGSVPPTDRLPVPNYFFASFIRFLCRFGQLSRPPSTEPQLLPLRPANHGPRLQRDAQYRVQYAYSLLMHYKPAYKPAWSQYVEKIQSFRTFGNRSQVAASIMKQYRAIDKVLQTLREMDLDADDELFRMLCTATQRAADAAYQGRLSREDRQYVFSTVRKSVRLAFVDLIGADVDSDNSDLLHDMHSISHIPKPAALHSYVRALGTLCDYEGLYSLSIWAATHHERITAVANEYPYDQQALFLMLVALRSGLEGRLRPENSNECATPELVQLVKARIESIEGWGWPSSKQVAEYCSNPNSPKLDNGLSESDSA